MRTLITVEMAVAALGYVTFIVGYLRVSWRKTREGRHVMFTTAVLAALIIMWFIGRVTGGLPPILWAIALGGLAVAAWWRVALFYRRQHESPPTPEALGASRTD